MDFDHDQTGGKSVSNWDGHKQIQQQYSIHGPVLDQLTAALPRDLKDRGLLENTLVLFIALSSTGT